MLLILFLNVSVGLLLFIIFDTNHINIIANMNMIIILINKLNQFICLSSSII